MSVLARSALVALLSLGLPYVPAAYAGSATEFTLRDLEGVAVNLADHKGKVIVLSFWATWCGPCKEEMPHLQKLYTEKKDQGFVLLSITADDARTASRVKPYIASKGFNFPVLFDKESAVVGIYDPGKTLPWTVVIDRDFQVVDSHGGYDPGDEVKLAAKVTELLAQPAK